MNKAVFLDRDGTVNIDYGYVHDIEKLEFMPGVAEALKRIQDNGFLLIIITNQSGIGRGYFSTEEYARFNKAMLSRMAEQGVKIDRIYTCPHIDEDHCSCRKPLLGLFEEAMSDFNIDLPNSYAVGDRLRDLSVCSKYPVRGILYSPKDGKNHDEKGTYMNTAGNIIRMETWEEIAEYICGKERRV